MPRPRTIWISPLVAWFATGCAVAMAQDRKGGRQAERVEQHVAPAQPAPMDMQRLLVLWEKQSAKLQTLEVSIYRTDKNPAWGDEEHYLGHAAFKSPQLAYLDFRKVKLEVQPDPKDKKKKILVPLKKDNGMVSTPHETIVCTGQEVWHYRYEVKQILIYPLDKDQRKRALEEGPLPFLFNMRADDARRRYQMVLQGEDKNRYLVMIKPLLVADQDSFSQAWVFLDKEFLLPKRIYLLAPDGTSSKDFQLSQIQANQPVKERYFVGIDPGKPWKVERNPGGPAPARPANARGQRRQPIGQAAQRPGDPSAGQPR
jgi:TIGR03009 family protein